MSTPRRLAKYLRDGTPMSVAQIRKAWSDGRVSVLSAESGPYDLDTLIFDADRVLLDGQPIAPRQTHFSAILNKPKGINCTVRDPRGKGDLRRWLEEMPAGTFPVGRLDRDTTGLLLFTTCGDLASAVLRPDHHTQKLYWLWLNETFDEDDPRLQKLTATDHPQYIGARAAELLHREPDYTELHVTLDQGKNRQIRRMCYALNLRLLHLHRKRIGPLSDSCLPLGQFRKLDETEVDRLWTCAGGREQVRARQILALRKTAAHARLDGRPHHRLESWLDALPLPVDDVREAEPG